MGHNSSKGINGKKKKQDREVEGPNGRGRGATRLWAHRPFTGEPALGVPAGALARC